MWISYQGNYPSEKLPERIRLSSGLTRTDPLTFTEAELNDAEYYYVDEKPAINDNQVLSWDSQNMEWSIRDKTLEELQDEINAVWTSIRAERDARIFAVTWRYERYARHERLGLTQVDNITSLDNYVQALADIPQTQTDPYDIVWPVLAE